MNHLRYVERTYNVPLLIAASKARVLEEIVRAHVEHRAIETTTPKPARVLAVPGAVRSEGGYYRTGAGIAIIPAIGTLVQRSADEDLDAFSGLAAYSTLRQQVQAADADPRVDAILFEVDSYGGEVPGIVDCVAAIRATGKKKPVWAIANEQALSAGMWIAAAATKVYAPRTGNVGSIGVRMLHVDQSQRDAKQGYIYTTIMAGERKNDFDPHSPLSETAHELAQEECDRIYDLFVADIAAFRGISEEKVRATQAGIFSAPIALDLSLIDDIQSFDETLAALTAEAQYVRVHGMRASAASSTLPATADSPGATTMLTEAEKAAHAAQVAEAEARGRAAAEAESKKRVTDAEAATAQAAKEAAAAAATAAQTRISGILTHAEAQGRRAQAEHFAFKTSMTVDEAAAALAAGAKEAPTQAENLLAGAMGKVPNPKVGADPGEGDETATDVAKRIAGYANGARKLAVVKK